MNRLLPPPVPESQLPAAVDWAIVSRRAIRAFLPTPVPRALLLEILDVARHSASGVNMQPWQVHVLTGAAQQRLSAAILRAHDDPATLAGLQEPYPYYPAHWVSPFLERRRQLGWQLYGLLGITRDDKARMHAQHARNYRFFDAPAGLIFTVHAALAQGSLIDYGMFLQSLMVAARARGLDTCPQVAFTPFHHIVAQQLGLPDTQRLVCGMSLGYADPSRPENALVSPREPVAGFTHFHDDEGSGPVPLP
ncbi:nitroreductase [Aquabacterium sp. OR-4]|uniref:nitroreductase n=1 Tax=Aquabacterium sp. OR-4 TaxID=2978127 RepID=UPI0021B1E005|nr:nitroreductase [Aquabacterium sp. OR-4]MDT7838037.1 nitroreductase [Aquabacterium sp. OR-4]